MYAYLRQTPNLTLSLIEGEKNLKSVFYLTTQYECEKLFFGNEVISGKFFTTLCRRKYENNKLTQFLFCPLIVFISQHCVFVIPACLGVCDVNSSQNSQQG